jgi:hypothetical protein
VRSLLVLAGLAACKHPPEADPAKFLAIADRMYLNVPAPMAVRTCKPEELVGASMTRRSLLLVDGKQLDPSAEHSDWINPTELDAPPIRVLLDANADGSAKRRATAELLAAPAYLVYRVDVVAAPIALGVKDLKIGTVGGRLFRYDKTGEPVCVVVYQFQNDKAKSDRALAQAAQSAVVPREVALAMRDDLHEQYIKNAPRAPTPQAAQP